MERKSIRRAKSGRGRKGDVALSIFKDQAEIRKQAEVAIEDLLAFNEKVLEEENKRGDATYEEARIFIFTVSFASILVSILMGVFIMRMASKAIQAVIETLSEGSLQVSTAAQQIASSSEELSQAAVEQAASLEQTASAIEEMNSMVGKNSDNAASTAKTSTSSKDKATEGRQVVEKMILSMDQINTSNKSIADQMNQSNEQFAGIVKVIEEIGSKTKVINDIVFQTKLLSFNASVEAARAGENGKGFAVVAEEVGNLARMSGTAAKEISELLEGSIQKVNAIVNETRTRVDHLIGEGQVIVEEGSKVARECGDVLQDIVHNVASVSVMAEEIASASQEQARGVNEITQAMGQLDQMTQQNSSTSQECAASAEQLSFQSEALKEAVGQLIVTINGNSGEDVALVSQASTVNRRAVTLAKKSEKPAAVKNVISFKQKTLSEQFTKPQTYKKAVGDVPSHTDEGFKDI